MSKIKSKKNKPIRWRIKRKKTPFTFKVAMISFFVLIFFSFSWIVSATALRTIATTYAVRGQRTQWEIVAMEQEIENLNIMISYKTNVAKLRIFAKERGFEFAHDRVKIIITGGDE